MEDYSFSISNFIAQAFREDVQDGDHTSLACIPAHTQGKAKLIIKQAGVLAGVEIAKEVFKITSSDFKINYYIKDGAHVKPGDIVLDVSGDVQAILKAERLVLNIMQRMSGIASMTASLVQVLNDEHTKLLDTRKTTPGFRYFEKEAVRIGGGTNHRFGLYDMILIKDNHVDYAGGIKEAIQAAQNYLKQTGKQLKIEIETRNIEEVSTALATGGIDRIMLDNFSIEKLKEAIELIDKKVEIEVSGGITPETLPHYSGLGIDYISMGALTHSYQSLDMSLKAF